MDEPSRQYDIWCDGQEGRYAELAGGMTCLDCAECTPSERGGYGGVGWCREAGCLVYAEDGTVADQGLECFAAR